MKRLFQITLFAILSVNSINAQEFNHIKYKRKINKAYIEGLINHNYARSNTIIHKVEKKYGKLYGEDYLLLSHNYQKMNLLNESANALKQAWSVHFFDFNCIMQIDSLQPMVLMNYFDENQNSIVQEGFLNFNKLKTPFGDSLYSVFEKINELDQQPRENLISKIKDSIESVNELYLTDSLNILHFQEIIFKYGYPGEWMIPGRSSISSLILVHSSYYEWFVKDMKKLLKKEVESGRMSPSEYLLWLDKYNQSSGKKLQYGMLDVPSQNSLTKKQIRKVKRKRIKYGLVAPFPIPSTLIGF